jgi:hypothetical protein
MQSSRMSRLTFASASLISLVIIAGTAAAHYWAGRTLICKCGYVKLWWWGEKGAAEESQHLLDIYTLSHVLHGLIFFFVIWLIFRGRISVWAGLVLAVILESGWELYENSNYLIARYRAAGYDYSGDSIVNSVADILAMAVGYAFAALVPWWVSLLLLVGVEVGMAALIRDNLLLNIIGLIKPIPWISKWQDGG